MEILIATGNGHKVGEIQGILGRDFHCTGLAGLRNVPEIVEDAGTFAGNATKKAVVLARFLAGTEPAGHWNFVLADDSGLEVDALGSRPGVHSARFAALDTGRGGNSSAEENNAKLLRLLKDVPADQRTARFKCAIALVPVLPVQITDSSPVCYADEHELQCELFEGACEGRIETQPRGAGGFGYDPLFTPLGHTETFAQLGEAIKNQLSHRAKALAKLKHWLQRSGKA